MKKYQGYIGSMAIASSYPFIVYGSVRGLVSHHRDMDAARMSLRKDRAGCTSQGGYTDAHVYAHDTAPGYRPVGSHQVWLAIGDVAST